MKYAIITICDNRNLGNRLQNFAVQETIKKIDPESRVETIINTNRKERGETPKRRLKNLLRDIKYFERTKSFCIFNKNIRHSKRSYDAAKNNDRLNEKYDFFLVGSDQVWNPNYGWLNSIDLLSFADNSKRIAFSASFGVSEIPEEYNQEVAKQLKQFKAISVREEAGAKIVKKLTGRNDVEVLVDPTMLLTTNEWDAVAKQPKQYKGEKFILCYFLGQLSAQRQKEIERIAKEKDCKIISILDKNDSYYASGPSEFVWLEKHAELICTDSFHSSVFAILYDRPFIIFNREQEGVKNMNSRIDTLLAKLEVDGRRYNGEKITDENLNHDYAKAYKNLEKERAKADAFLRKALGR